MSRILFLHGFTSSGSCEIAETLKSEMAEIAKIVSPDILLRPFEAMDMLQDICESERFDLIVGSSCGSFYGQQLVRLTGVPALLVSPFFKMTEFLEPRIGIHQYKSRRIDGRQQFEITGRFQRYMTREDYTFDGVEAAYVVIGGDDSHKVYNSLKIYGRADINDASTRLSRGNMSFWVGKKILLYGDSITYLNNLTREDGWGPQLGCYVGAEIIIRGWGGHIGIPRRTRQGQ